jgi:hypothetical protein
MILIGLIEVACLVAYDCYEFGKFNDNFSGAEKKAGLEESFGNLHNTFQSRPNLQYLLK